MSFNPSERRKGEMDEELQLNLNPMMDMFGVLIPALLMMSTVVEVAVLNVAAPAIDPNPQDTPPPPDPDKPPLNFTVTITDAGYMLFGAGAPINSDGKAPSIPLIEKPVPCTRYRGTYPPPRAKNKDASACPEAEKSTGMASAGNMPKTEMRPFAVYDTKALATKAMELKNEYPDERRIIIQPSPDTEYEAIIDVMDATRDIQEPNGDVRPLFDEVVMGGGAM